MRNAFPIRRSPASRAAVCDRPCPAILLHQKQRRKQQRFPPQGASILPHERASGARPTRGAAATHVVSWESSSPTPRGVRVSSPRSGDITILRRMEQRIANAQRVHNPIVGARTQQRQATMGGKQSVSSPRRARTKALPPCATSCSIAPAGLVRERESSVASPPAAAGNGNAGTCNGAALTTTNQSAFPGFGRRDSKTATVGIPRGDESCKTPSHTMTTAHQKMARRSRYGTMVQRALRLDVVKFLDETTRVKLPYSTFTAGMRECSAGHGETP